MKSCASAPITAAGRNAISTPMTKRARRPIGEHADRQLPQPRRNRSTAAPGSRRTGSAPRRSCRSPRRRSRRSCSTSSRCPVDETGRNSVRPSTMPRTTALIRSRSAELEAGEEAPIEVHGAARVPEARQAPRLWRKAAIGQRNRGDQQVARRGSFLYAAFYSACSRFSPEFRRRQPMTSPHADTVPSSVLPAFALRPPGARRVRHRGARWSRSGSGSGARNSCCSIRPAPRRCWWRRASRRCRAPPSSPNISTRRAAPTRRSARLMPPRPVARVEVRRLATWFNDKFFAEVSGPLVTERVLQAPHDASSRAAARPTPTRSAPRATISAIIWPISAGWCARATGSPASD